MNDPLVLHTALASDLLFGSELDGRETLEYQRLQRFDPPCPLCSVRNCEQHCDLCIELGHQCGQCCDEEPLEHESQDAYDSRMAGIPRRGEI